MVLNARGTYFVTILPAASVEAPGLVGEAYLHSAYLTNSSVEKVVASQTEEGFQIQASLSEASLNRLGPLLLVHEASMLWFGAALTSCGCPKWSLECKLPCKCCT